VRRDYCIVICETGRAGVAPPTWLDGESEIDAETEKSPRNEGEICPSQKTEGEPLVMNNEWTKAVPLIEVVLWCFATTRSRLWAVSGGVQYCNCKSNLYD